MNANLVVVFSLISAIIAALKLRSVDRQLVVGSVVLFVLTVAQTVIGHQITDESRERLLAIHVPLAFVIFGLSLVVAGPVHFRRTPATGPIATSRDVFDRG
jgi:putative Ca2+/H+ antiporter (TMEM165/GDT1 family)